MERSAVDCSSAIEFSQGWQLTRPSFSLLPAVTQRLRKSVRRTSILGSNLYIRLGQLKTHLCIQSRRGRYATPYPSDVQILWDTILIVVGRAQALMASSTRHETSPQIRSSRSRRFVLRPRTKAYQVPPSARSVSSKNSKMITSSGTSKRISI
jgi:hypothetical protein